MKSLRRFGVSIDTKLLKEFDGYISEKGYKNRSEALRDLIRDKLMDEKISDSDSELYGVIIYLYDHHKREIDTSITDFQHQHYESIIYSSHIHIDHTNCLEMIVVRDTANQIQHIADNLFAMKGVHFGKIISVSGKH